MDFFAAGGFQQLFCDLDEHIIEYDYHVMAADYTDYNNTPISINNNNHNNTSLYQLQFEQTWSTELKPIEMKPKNDDFFGLNKQIICYEIIKEKNTEKPIHPIDDVNEAITNDWSNNNSYQNTEIHLNEKQLQYSLDLLLPMTDDETVNQVEFDDFSTDYFITREMSDWEERFLDNYIEIPELIDFLPEKTPLCTDECELFLQESTKNLRLHRKQRKQQQQHQKQNSNCDTPKAGYTCTFGDCCKVYAKPAHLKAHLRRHLGEKPYVCNWPDCTWRFSRSDELARHRRSHSGVKPYKCDYCTKCFARSDHLTKHRKVHERRLLAASKAGKVLDGEALPYSILTVRPGRKRKNQIC